jgi:hypothetical protein
MSVQRENMNGITCGKRDNGARCVLWDNDVFEWFNSAEFSALIGE